MSSASDPASQPEVPRPADPAGLDPAVSIAGPAAAAAPPGWWARNWKWFVPLVTVAPCLVCGLGGLGLLSFSSSNARRMDAYQIALDTVRGSEDLQAVIGQPIEEVESLLMPAQGRQAKTEEGTIVASVTFYVEGPKGRAKVTAQAYEKNDDWRLNQLEAEPVGHEPIVIVQTREQEREQRFGAEPSP